MHVHTYEKQSWKDIHGNGSRSFPSVIFTLFLLSNALSNFFFAIGMHYFPNLKKKNHTNNFYVEKQITTQRT